MSRGSSPTTSGSNDLRMAVRPGAKKHSPSPRRPSSVSRRTKVQSKFPSTTAVFRRVIFNGLAFLNGSRCRRLDTPTNAARDQRLCTGAPLSSSRWLLAVTLVRGDDELTRMETTSLPDAIIQIKDAPGLSRESLTRPAVVKRFLHLFLPL